MTITYAGQGTTLSRSAHGGSGTVYSPAYPSIAAGDVEFLVVVGRAFLNVAGTPTITVPGDWTEVHPPQMVLAGSVLGVDFNQYIGVWWRLSTGSTATVPITWTTHFSVTVGGSQGDFSAVRHAFRGIVAPAGNIDHSTASGTGVSFTSPPVTAPNGDWVTLTWTSLNASSDTPSNDHGFTTSVLSGGAWGYKVGATPGAVTMPVWAIGSLSIARVAISTVFATTPPVGGWHLGLVW